MRQRHIRICDVAVDIVGAHPRNVVVPLQGDPCKRPRETSLAKGAFPLADCSARGCLWADVSPWSKGQEVGCAMRRRRHDLRRRL